MDQDQDTTTPLTDEQERRFLRITGQTPVIGLRTRQIKTVEDVFAAYEYLRDAYAESLRAHEALKDEYNALTHEVEMTGRLLRRMGLANKNA
jgi:hypothetical protein